MRWSLRFLLIGFASIANALLPGWHLIDNLNELTTTTKFLLSPARDISLVNAPQIIIRRGPLYVRLPIEFHLCTTDRCSTSWMG